MAEKFDVRLTEKYYMPDPSSKKHSWLGDYQKAYDELLKDPDTFWDKLQRNFTGSHRILMSRNGIIRTHAGLLTARPILPTTALTGMCRMPAGIKLP